MIYSNKYATISDAWFGLLYNIQEHGYKQPIQRGSFAGDANYRIQYPFVAIEIEHPSMDMIPTMPQGMESLSPTTMEYVEDYFVNYLLNDELKENEVYCYSNDTEVLTKAGWKLFKDLHISDVVATMDPLSHNIEYQTIEDYYSLPYEGKLVHVKSTQVDTLVTPNHKVLFAKNNSTLFSLETIDKVRELYRFRFKRDGIWNRDDLPYFDLPEVEYNNYRYSVYGKRKNIPMDVFLKFFGIWLAEGSLRRYKNKYKYTITITQRNTYNRDLIVKELSEYFNLSVYDKDILINDKQLYVWLSQFGKSRDKFIPRELLNLSARQLTILFSWMYLGDGSKGAHKQYSTISKQLADDVQELCLKIGVAANIVYDKSDSIYRIHIAESFAFKNPHLMSRNIADVPYVGKVYCVKVAKYHTLYVRRNGKACWSGNTYGSRIKPYINKLIEILKITPYTNQAALEIASPGDIFLNDPTCLRSITFKVIDNKLNMSLFFRSNDLYGGLPSNLAGLELLKQLIASESNLENGKIYYASDGLHIYNNQLDIVNTRLNRNK